MGFDCAVASASAEHLLVQYTPDEEFAGWVAETPPAQTDRFPAPAILMRIPISTSFALGPSTSVATINR